MNEKIETKKELRDLYIEKDIDSFMYKDRKYIIDTQYIIDKRNQCLYENIKNKNIFCCGFIIGAGRAPTVSQIWEAIN